MKTNKCFFSVIPGSVLPRRSNLTKLRDYFVIGLRRTPRNDTMLNLFAVLLTVGLSLFLFYTPACAQGGDQPLSLKQCVNIALKQQPSIRASIALT